MTQGASLIRRLFRVRAVFAHRAVWVGVAALVCVVLYMQIGRWFVRPAALRQLRQLCGDRVAMGSVSFRGGRHITCRDVVIEAGQGSVYDRQMITAREVHGRVSLWSLVRFRPRFKRVTLMGVHINAQYDIDQRTINLGALGGAVGDGMADLPIIAFEQCVLRVSSIGAGDSRTHAIVGLDGRIAPAPGKKGDYGFYFAANESLAFGGSYLRGTWQSTRRRIRLSEGRIIMGDSPVLDNSWRMEDLALEMSYNDADVFLDKFEWRTPPRSRGRIEGAIRDWRGEGRYTVQIEMDDWLLSPRSAANAVVYGDEALRLVGAGLREFLETYQPTGRGGLDVSTSGTISQWSSDAWSGLIHCHDISICYVKFPYTLDHMMGTLRLPAETEAMDIVFDNLRCRHEGVDWVIDGQAVKVGDEWSYGVTLSSDNMVFDEDLRAALTEQQQALWQTFSPAGPARINYTWGREHGQDMTGLLVIRLDGAAAVYEHFPYPMQNLTGTVEITEDNIAFKDVVSRYDGDSRVIRMNGHVEAIESDQPRFHMIIDARNIPIDAALQAALPERQRRFYEHFDVDAVTDAIIRVFPNEVGRRPVEYIAQVQIRDASLVYREFPLPLVGVDIDAQLTADKIVIKQMTARHGNGRLEVSGEIWPVSDRFAEPGYCLDVRAHELELNEEWMCGLPQELTETAARLRPAGPVNLAATLNVNAPAADCAPFHIAVECLGNSFRPVELPYAVENVIGRIDITPKELRLKDFRLPGIRLDAALHEMLPLEAAKAYAAIAPAGELDFHVGDARFFKQDGQARVDVKGEAILKGCAFGDLGRVSNMEGVLKVDVAYAPGAGLLAGQATLHADSMTVKNRTFGNVRADIAYDPNAQSFATRDFAASLYGGKVVGDAEIIQTPAGLRYEVTAVFEDVDVGAMVAAGRPSESAAALAPASHGYARGSVGLRGAFGKVGSNLGRVRLNMDRMKVAPRSLLGKVIETMQFNQPTDYWFSDLAVDAFVQGRQLVFQEVYVSGPGNVLLGKGKLDLQENDIDMEFRSYGTVVTSDPSFFETLARGLGAAVMRVKIDGTLDEPHIQTTPLPVLQNPLGLLGR